MNPVKLITPSIYDPVTLEEAKNHLRVTSDDEDAIINLYLNAAIERVQNYRQSQIMSAEYELYSNDFMPNVNLQKNPVTAINSVKYYDTSNALQTVSPSYYRLLDFRVPCRLEFDNTFIAPLLYDREYPVVINFQAGFHGASGCGAAIKHVILATLGTFNEIRQMEDTGMGLAGVQMSEVSMELLDSETMWL